MCYAFAGVMTRDEVYIAAIGDAHSEIIRKVCPAEVGRAGFTIMSAGTRRQGNQVFMEFRSTGPNARSPHFPVSFEVLPPDWDYRRPFCMWTFKCDQDIKPEWYFEPKAIARSYGALARWGESHVLAECDGKTLGDLKSGERAHDGVWSPLLYSFLKDCRATPASGRCFKCSFSRECLADIEGLPAPQEGFACRMDLTELLDKEHNSPNYVPLFHERQPDVALAPGRVITIPKGFRWASDPLKVANALKVRLGFSMTPRRSAFQVLSDVHPGRPPVGTGTFRRSVLRQIAGIFRIPWL